jgi:hypothetical protein
MDARRDELLQDHEEWHQVGFKVPAPLSGRLDGLVEVARRSGENTNRKELLGALIVSAPESGKELARLIRRYRGATVAEALVRGVDDEEILNPHLGRGPRPKGRGKGRGDG